MVKAFAAEALAFPGRHDCGPRAGELYWKALRHDHVLFVLHNPRYAGAYFYGRRRQITDAQGSTHNVVKPREDWTVFIPDAHAGYISLERFEANQARLAANAASRGDDRRAGPPREGLALLQGLVVCGRCGRRMTVGYNQRCDGSLVPYYRCQPEGIARGTTPCQTVCGSGVDDAVAALAPRELSPLGIEAALAVSAELADRTAEADRIRATTVERARHAAEAARRRQRHTPFGASSLEHAGAAVTSTGEYPGQHDTATGSPAVTRSAGGPRPRGDVAPTDHRLLRLVEPAVSDGLVRAAGDHHFPPTDLAQGRRDQIRARSPGRS